VARYRVVPERSRVDIEASSSVHPIRGSATGLEGEIDVTLRGSRLVLSEEVAARIDLAVSRLSSSNPLEDIEMKRRAEVRKYPTIVGEVREVHAGKAGGYVVAGNLTFHGVARRVEGEIELTVDENGTLVIKGEQTFDVRDFGIEPPRILMLRVHPEVHVRLHLEATRAR
jgi:polyisoprenoid-binding protein YceI